MSSVNESNHGLNHNVNQKPSKGNIAANTNNKIKILSQSILKTANLTARKDYLSKVLEDSERTTIINKSQQKDTNTSRDENKIFNKGVSSDVKSSNFKLNRSQEKSPINHVESNPDKEYDKKSDSDDSMEYENKIKKPQVSRLDDKQNDIKIKKAKNVRKHHKKKLEMLSNSSDSEDEPKNNPGDKVSLSKQRKLETISSSCNSDSDNDDTSHKKLANRRKSDSSSSEASDSIKNKNSKSSSSDRPTERTSESGKNNIQKNDSSSSDSDSKSSDVIKNRNVRSVSSDTDTDRSSESGKNTKPRSCGSGSKNRKSRSSSSDSSSEENSKSRKNTKPLSRSSSSESSGNGRSSSSDTSSEKNTMIHRKKTKSRSHNSSSGSDTDRQVINKKNNSSKLKRKYNQINSSDEEFAVSNKNRKISGDSVKKIELSESQKLLEKFCSRNEYQKVIQKRQNVLETLTKDNEIYLVHIPKNVDPCLLLDKKISFNAKSKIKVDDEVYSCNINYKDNNNITLLNFDKLLNLNLNGVINIQHYFKRKSDSFEIKPLNDIAELPSNLKVRHPLFGTDYEEKIDLDEDITRKLEEIVERVNKKTKKRSKRMTEKHVIQDEDNLDIFKLLNERDGNDNKMPNKKKKKKKKHKEGKDESTTQEMENDALSIISELFCESKSHKTKRKDLSYKSGSGNQCDVLDEHFKPKKKHKKRSSFDFSKETSSIDSTTAIPPKKSKKDKHRDREINVEQIQSVVKHKKKKRDKNQLPSWNPWINNDTDTSKKKVEDDINIVNSTMSTPSMHKSILQLDESCIVKPKKKKNHHSKSIDHFIDDLIKDVTSSEEIVKQKNEKTHQNKQTDN